MLLGMGPLPEKYVQKYDCLTCIGSLVPAHIPSAAFDQMYDAVIPRGYIVFSVRDKYYISEGHKAKVDEMVQEGKFKFVKQYCWVRNEEMEGDKKTELFYPEPSSVYVF